jgi:hypothetical protein
MTQALDELGTQLEHVRQDLWLKPGEALAALALADEQVLLITSALLQTTRQQWLQSAQQSSDPQQSLSLLTSEHDLIPVIARL